MANGVAAGQKRIAEAHWQSQSRAECGASEFLRCAAAGPHTHAGDTSAHCLTWTEVSARYLPDIDNWNIEDRYATGNQYTPAFLSQLQLSPVGIGSRIWM